MSLIIDMYLTHKDPSDCLTMQQHFAALCFDIPVGGCAGSVSGCIFDRDEDGEGGSEEKKSKRHKRDKEKRHRSSRKSEPVADAAEERGSPMDEDEVEGETAKRAAAGPAAAADGASADAAAPQEVVEDGEL